MQVKKKQVSMQMQRKCECKFHANKTVHADANPIGSVKASAKANATKITNVSTNVSANAMRLMQKPMQLQNASTQANTTKATNASTSKYKCKCNATFAKTDSTTKCK